MTAEEIMVKDIITVKCGTPLGEAFKTIREKNIRQLPVVGEKGRVAGLITPRKLFEIALPGYIKEGFLEDVRYAPDTEKFLFSFRDLAAKDVCEVMEKEVVKVSPEISAMEIATLFTRPRRQIDCILVVDKADVLVGIITPEDVAAKLCKYISE
jgi:CBS-domain-containing membrane protein